MKVATRDDYDTHAVIGGNEVMEFGIAQTAEFFTVLSNTLYSNKPMAVVREVLCNAWDAHKASNRRHLPVKVTVTEDKLVFRDQGYGIPHHLIQQIYCVYGASTKENDGNQTGGFGLGSKAPFAYTEHFTVTNHHAGTKKVYAISRGSALTKGRPDIRTMVNIPTTEEGVEVSIPVKNRVDMRTFTDLVRDLASYGEMNVSLNNEIVETVKISEAENNLFLIANLTIPNSNRVINVRYGDVLYPIEPHDDIAAHYNTLIRLIGEMPVQNSYRGFTWKLILQAEPNTISVTPSRESLSMSDTTVKTLNKLLQNACIAMQNDGTMNRQIIESRLDWAIDEMYRRGKPDQILLQENLLKHAKERELSYQSTNFDIIKNQLEMVDYMMCHSWSGYYYNQSNYNYVLKRLVEFGHRRNVDIKKYLHTLKKSGSRTVTPFSNIFSKRIVRPLLKRLARHELLSHKNMYHYSTNSYNLTKGFVEITKKKPDNFFEESIRYLQGVIVVAHSKQSVLDDLRRMPETKAMTNKNGVYIYVAPRSASHKQAALDFFRHLGFYVIDFADWIDEDTRRFNSNTRSLLPVVKIPKVEGLPALRGLVTKHGFACRHLLDHNEDTDPFPRIVDYDYVVKGAALTEKYREKFFPWGDSNARTLIQRYGTKIAIVNNSRQLEAHVAKGKKEGFRFIAEQISNEIITNPRIQNYYKRQANSSRTSSEFDILYKIAEHSAVIAKLLDVPDPMTNEDRLIISIFNDMKSRVYRHQDKDIGWEGSIATAMKHLAQYDGSSHDSPIEKLIREKSYKLNFLDLPEIYSAFASSGAKLSAANRVHLEICLVNALT